ncbi:hypothetical protein EYF80_030235 [Liparis tanakae]|uniref:Uncharacterized protein n=1 Tax=Liparis tanakae TaxID=230148 RepID=A0A4Z2H1R4_9TELE|nr:hypothetical protein EYF80_030235 [Liparis tanakae]
MKAAEIPVRSFYRENSIKVLEKIKNKREHPIRTQSARLSVPGTIAAQHQLRFVKKRHRFVLHPGTSVCAPHFDASLPGCGVLAKEAPVHLAASLVADRAVVHGRHEVDQLAVDVESDLAPLAGFGVDLLLDLAAQLLDGQPLPAHGDLVVGVRRARPALNQLSEQLVVEIVVVEYVLVQVVEMRVRLQVSLQLLSVFGHGFGRESGALLLPQDPVFGTPGLGAAHQPLIVHQHLLHLGQYVPVERPEALAAFSHNQSGFVVPLLQRGVAVRLESGEALGHEVRILCHLQFPFGRPAVPCRRLFVLHPVAVYLLVLVLSRGLPQSDGSRVGALVQQLVVQLQQGSLEGFQSFVGVLKLPRKFSATPPLELGEGRRLWKLVGIHQHFLDFDSTLEQMVPQGQLLLHSLPFLNLLVYFYLRKCADPVLIHAVFVVVVFALLLLPIIIIFFFFTHTKVIHTLC